MNRTVPKGVLSAAAALAVVLAGASPAVARGWHDRQCVSPTGADDTGRLQSALDGCVGARRGCVVRLCEGVFLTGPLRVGGFRGTLRGAGQDRTILRALPDLEVNSNPDGYWRDDPLGPAPWPYLLQFIGGEGAVRDLALEVPDPGPGSKPTLGWTEYGGDRYEMAGALLITGVEPVDFEVKGVGVRADTFDNDGFEDQTLFSAVAARGLVQEADPIGDFPVRPLRGRIRVVDNDLSESIVGTSLGELKDADVLISRNRVHGFIAVDILDARDSRVRVLRNRWEVRFVGVQVYLNIDDDPSTDNLFLVALNQGTIDSLFGAGAGVYFQDPWFLPEPGNSALGVIANDLTLGSADERGYRAIEAIGAGRLRIDWNRLRGEVRTGILVDDTSGCRVVGNQLAGLETRGDPHLALGTDTEDCLAVVGRDDSVRDDGTNNRLIRLW